MKSSFSSILAVLGAAAGISVSVGCSLGTHDSALSATQIPASGTLSLVGEASIALLPGDSQTLAVLYKSDAGKSPPGIPVEFAVLAADQGSPEKQLETSVPPGASLTPSTPLTDERGIASAVLSVGSTSGSFRVRASVPGADSVFYDVVVREALTPSLSVKASYAGLRKLASRSVTLVPSMSCTQAMAQDMVGNEVRTVNAPEDVLEFKQLGAGLSYAVVAWGRDDTGAGLTRGCKEYAAPITASEDQAHGTLVVSLDDLPMRLMGSYPLTLTLDVRGPMQRLGDLTRNEAVTSIGGSTPLAEAGAYLDALDTVLRAQDPTGTAADTLAQRRLDGSVDAQALADSLSENAVGLFAAADELAKFWTDAGPQLVLSATYGVGAPSSVPMTLAVTDMVARSADGNTAFDLAGLTGYVAPTASVVASYDDAKAVVEVTALSVMVGLDEYGRSLLAASIAANSDWVVSRLGAHAGCDRVSTWLSAQSSIDDLCDQACAEQVCPTALSKLVNDVRDALQSLDAAHPAISLAGVMAVHDRTNDGVVDDLGPFQTSLEGNWGQAQSQVQQDAVTAQVASPPSQGALAP